MFSIRYTDWLIVSKVDYFCCWVWRQCIRSSTQSMDTQPMINAADRLVYWPGRNEIARERCQHEGPAAVWISPIRSFLTWTCHYKTARPIIVFFSYSISNLLVHFCFCCSVLRLLSSVSWYNRLAAENVSVIVASNGTLNVNSVSMRCWFTTADPRT